MFGSPTRRHFLPTHVKANEKVCPECKGAKYVGPILGITPCPLGCAEEANKESAEWSAEELVKRAFKK